MKLYGIILASGRHERLRAISDPTVNRHALSKALVPVGNRKAAGWAIEALKTLGLKKIYVGAGPRPLSDGVETHFSDHHAFGVDIEVRSESKISDTMGLTMHFVNNVISGLQREDTICVVPCDTIHAIDLKPIFQAHLKKKSSVTAMALPIRWSSPEWNERTFGTIEMGIFSDLESYNDRDLFEKDSLTAAKAVSNELALVKGFHEQQNREQARTPYINTATYFFNAGFLMDIAPFVTPIESEARFSDFGLHALPLLARRWEHELLPFNISGDFLSNLKNGDYPFYAYLLSPDTYWQDVGTPHSLLRVNMDFLRNKLGSNIDPNGRFWIKTDWGWSGRFGTYIDRTAVLNHPAPDTMGSLIGNHVVVKSQARISESIILDYTTIDERAEIFETVRFPANDRRDTRRVKIGHETKLIRCLHVSGRLPKGTLLEDKIIYETPYGGVAIDPL